MQVKRNAYVQLDMIAHSPSLPTFGNYVIHLKNALRRRSPIVRISRNLLTGVSGVVNWWQGRKIICGTVAKGTSPYSELNRPRNDTL
jgi:hypothetical protein